MSSHEILIVELRVDQVRSALMARRPVLLVLQSLGRRARRPIKLVLDTVQLAQIKLRLRRLDASGIVGEAARTTQSVLAAGQLLRDIVCFGPLWSLLRHVQMVGCRCCRVAVLADG